MPTQPSDPTYEWLKNAKATSRMSFAELARQTGVTRQAVGKWFDPDPKKRTAPAAEHLRRVEEVTHVPWGTTGTLEVREGPSPYTHSKGTLFIRDVMRLVRALRPDLVANFDRPVEIPGARLARLDYVSNQLALEVSLGASRSTALPMAWHLALLARVDQGTSASRRVVFAAPTDQTILPGELRLMGVEAVQIDTPEDVVGLILEAESR